MKEKIAIMIFVVIAVLPLVQSICTDNCIPGSGTSYYAPGFHTFFLTHDNILRKYIVYVPQNYTGATTFPVIFAFHGGGGNADQSVQFFQLNETADKDNFIVVYPQGYGTNPYDSTTWNAGRCCGEAMQDNSDDVGFVRDVVAQIEKDFFVDKKRIYAVGQSNGALFTYRLACEASDIFAGIGVASGQDSFDDCHPEHPIPILHIHGTEDTCVPYTGGTCGGCLDDMMETLHLPHGNDTWSCRSVKEYMDDWIHYNKCDQNTIMTIEYQHITCISYPQCSQNAEVAYCFVSDMGHTWPGVPFDPKECERSPLFCNLWHNTMGPTTFDMNANDFIWSFFERHAQ